MESQHYKIEVPKKAANAMGFADPDRLMLTITHNRAGIESQDLFDRTPSIEWWWYLIPALLMTVVFMVYCHLNHLAVIPLNGDNSIATVTMILSCISGLIGFAAVFIHDKIKATGPAKDFSWRSLPTLVVALGAILAFSFSAVFWLIGQMFKGARFDAITAGLMIFTIVAVMNYMQIYLAKILSSQVITTMMLVMIIGGMIFSMVTNSNSNWWHYNFSFLGTTRNSGNLQFNITLIFSGLIMMTLIDYLFVALKEQMSGIGTQIVRWLLYGEAACVAGIGLFPNNQRFHHFHDSISMWLVYFMLILIVGLRWFMPQLPKRFLHVSYVMGSLMGFDYIIFETTMYLSLTAFELLEFFLAFSWLLLFFEYLQTIAAMGRQIFYVKLKPADQTELKADTDLHRDDDLKK